MDIFGRFKKTDVELLKERVDQGDAVERMMATEGWAIVYAHFQEQLEAYKADNATNATNWDDYLKKSGKIFGIQLFLANLEDFIRMGKEAAEKLDKLDN